MSIASGANRIQRLKAAEHRVMPWKNGGGVTTEIAVWPAEAGLADFAWRVSMARVEADGPFSSFPGIDRTLCILEGAGLTLSVAGEPDLVLRRDGKPHAFPADQATSAALIDGPIIDLNVMSRRGVIAHNVRRVFGPAEAALDISSDPVLLLAQGAKVSVAGCELAHDDALLFPLGLAAKEQIMLEAGATLYVISFAPA
jgi:uncharacterized protein